MTAQPGAAFDDVIHAPVRLRICGALRSVQTLEFAVVRDTLEITDAHLSKNLKVLADSGYVVLRKERSPSRGDSRRLTWISLTPQGRSALEAHLVALSQIIDGGLTRS